MLLKAFDHGLYADGIGPEHWPAGVERPAVAVDPHHIDVARALGHALAEDQRAFVDHRVEQALANLVLADRALRLAFPGSEFGDDRLGLLRGRAVAGLVVVVEALAGLLPKAALCAKS